MYVLKKSLEKQDRSQVTLAVRNFKEKKAEEVAKEKLDDKIWQIKDKNERQMEKVSQRKVVIEA